MSATVIAVTALIISILGIIISGGIAIYVYRKTNIQTLILHEDSKRGERISSVVNKYHQLLVSHNSSDMVGLIRAGMATLKDDDEAREVIQSVANLQSQRNPLSNWQSDVEQVGILRFFQNITDKEFMEAGKCEEIIRNLRGSTK